MKKQLYISFVLLLIQIQVFSQKLNVETCDYNFFNSNQIAEIKATKFMYNKRGKVKDSLLLFNIICDMTEKKVYGKYYHKTGIIHDPQGIRTFFKKYNYNNDLTIEQVTIDENSFKTNKYNINNTKTELIRKYYYNSFDSLAKFDFYKCQTIKYNQFDTLYIKDYISRVYKYNDKNQRIKEYSKYGDEEYFLNYEWLYDLNNNVIQINNYQRDSSLWSKTFFKFDSSNNVIERIDSYCSNFSEQHLILQIKYEYQNSKIAKKTEINFYKNTPNDSIVTLYDENENIVKEENNESWNSYVKQYEYKDNYLIKYTYINKSKEDIIINAYPNILYEYKYNSNKLLSNEININPKNKKIMELIIYDYIFN